MLSLVRIIIAAFAEVKKFLQIKLDQFNNRNQPEVNFLRGRADWHRTINVDEIIKQ